MTDQLSDRHSLIQKRLRDEGDKLLAIFEALNDEQWSMTIYTDGAVWTIKDLLAHQVSAEREFQYYGRDILAGGSGAPEDFSINTFNNAAVVAMADRTAADLLDALRVTRQASIDLVATIEEANFTRQGRHPYFGLMTIEDMFKLIYRHNMMHARDVRRVLETTTLGGAKS
ncbi:MAG: DinB family protein [Thermoflexales bacterium]|nr:DinB family protein [Thermoflexales bacterium]